MSIHEIEFSKKLDTQRRKWILCERFKLGKSTYRPDFYLPEEDLYIELAYDQRNYDHNKVKYEEFKLLYPEKKFIVVDMNFETYPKKKREIYHGQKCIHCGYTWDSIKENPRTCPRCKRYDWKENK